jgi:hypothetical protein
MEVYKRSMQKESLARQILFRDTCSIYCAMHMFFYIGPKNNDSSTQINPKTVPKQYTHKITILFSNLSTILSNLLPNFTAHLSYLYVDTYLSLHKQNKNYAQQLHITSPKAEHKI